VIVEALTKAVEEGLAERKTDREMEKDKEVSAEDETTEGTKSFVVEDDDEVKVVVEKKAPRAANLRPRRGGPGGSKKND